MEQNSKSLEKLLSRSALSPDLSVNADQGEKADRTLPPEYGGRKGPEATRFGDWEMNGKCVDF